MSTGGKGSSESVSNSFTHSELKHYHVFHCQYCNSMSDGLKCKNCGGPKPPPAKIDSFNWKEDEKKAYKQP